MRLLETIGKTIENNPYKIEAYDDYFSICRSVEDKEFDTAHKGNAWLRSMLAKNMKDSGNITAFFELYKKTLLFDAKYDFDCYLLYLEINREPKDRFYQPRRKILFPVVQAMQDLADDKLDELFLSLPPRVGKTSLMMFFISWVIGKYPEKTNLYSAHSDVITSALYNGLLEIINDPVTYLWHDVFVGKSIASTNSKEETIDIDRKKRYHSLTARSILGTLNGACDCNNFLIIDDVVADIEEVLNKDRMVSKWMKVDNNLLPRRKETAKTLWIGTRWSVIDPAGIRMEMLENDENFKNIRYKIINIPTLDENDESNFCYDYGVGFSTEHYHKVRASFERRNDVASWLAQFMGVPIEREGTLFQSEDFRFYNGELPNCEPDRVFMAVDPAFGGGDFVAAPICFQYGDDIYVHDVVFDDGDKRITLPLLVDAIGKYEVAACQIEVSKATSGYKDELATKLKEKNLRINLLSKPASPLKAKEQRIFDKAPNIRENMIFRESGKRTKAYELFMQNVFSFKMFGKNKHDDAPDSLAMAIDMAFGRQREAKVFTRMF